MNPKFTHLKPKTIFKGLKFCIDFYRVSRAEAHDEARRLAATLGLIASFGGERYARTDSARLSYLSFATTSKRDALYPLLLQRRAE